MPNYGMRCTDLKQEAAAHRLHCPCGAYGHIKQGWLSVRMQVETCLCSIGSCMHQGPKACRCMLSHSLTAHRLGRQVKGDPSGRRGFNGGAAGLQVRMQR